MNRRPFLLLACFLILGKKAVQAQASDPGAFDPTTTYPRVCGKNTSHVQPNPDLSGQGTVRVDLAQIPTTRDSLTGFLLGTNPSTPLALAKALRPGLWRGGEATSSAAQAVGAPSEFILMGAWGVPGKGWKRPGHKGQRPGGPYDYPRQWAAAVAQTGREFSNQTTYWEIWNEPDCSFSWDSTPEKLFKTYGVAYHALERSLGSDLKMGGPGLNIYNRDYIRAFLDYALEHRLKVSFISWHELRWTEDDLPSITEHLQEARRLFLQNSKYQSLGLKEIHINENVGPHNRYRPGEILGQFYFLEQGGADKAARSCWKDSPTDPTEDCWNGSLDGLIVPADEYQQPDTWFKPRSAWWAYKSYADTLSNRIPCESSNPQIVCFADLNNRSAQILLGYYGTQYDFPPTSLNLQFQNAQVLARENNNRAVNVRILRLPDSGTRPVSQLPVISRSQARVSGNSLTIPLPPILIHEGLLITVTGQAGNMP